MGDTNQASYELCLARALLQVMAERLKSEDDQNALYAISDCVTRAKAIVDGEEEQHG